MENTHMETTHNAAREFKGRHLLIIMVCFFATIIGVNLTMALIASQSWTGLVVKNSYVESQKFNSYLKQAEKQKALGWTSRLEVDKGRLAFLLYDQSGKILRGFDVRATAERPAHENEDRTLFLTQNATGQYVHEESLTKGAWKIKITALNSDGIRYRQDFHILVKKE